MCIYKNLQIYKNMYQKNVFTKPIRCARGGFNSFCVIVPAIGNENLIKS